MENIDFALCVLRSEIFNLKNRLELGHYFPKQEENIKNDIEKITKAIEEIKLLKQNNARVNYVGELPKRPRVE